MGHGNMHVRTRADIELVEHMGYGYRRHIGALDTKGESPSTREAGFGALRLFDDVTIDPGAHVSVDAHDGMEIVVYVLEGECVVEDDRGDETVLAPGGAASLVLGQGVRFDLRNPSSAAPSRALVAAVATPIANPQPRLAVGPFGRQTGDFMWVDTHGDQMRVEGSVVAGVSARLGVGTLDSGVELGFSRDVSRGLFVDVLEGHIELGSGFVDEGGDAMLSLDAPVRLQAITRSRVVIADVPMGYVQELE